MFKKCPIMSKFLNIPKALKQYNNTRERTKIYISALKNYKTVMANQGGYGLNTGEK